MTKTTLHPRVDGFPQRLASTRAQRGLSVRVLAEASNVGASTISELETGVNQQPGIGVCALLAYALDVSPAWLAFALGDGPDIRDTKQRDPIEFYYWAYTHAGNEIALKTIQSRSKDQKGVPERYASAISTAVHNANAGFRPLSTSEIRTMFAQGPPTTIPPELPDASKNRELDHACFYYEEAYARISARRSAGEAVYLLDLWEKADRLTGYEKSVARAIALAAWDVIRGSVPRLGTPLEQMLSNLSQ